MCFSVVCITSIWSGAESHWCVDFFPELTWAEFMLLICNGLASLIFFISFNDYSENIIKCFGVCSHSFNIFVLKKTFP